MVSKATAVSSTVITDRIRAVYFTAVPIASDVSGGALVCRNHIQRLAGDARLSVAVVTTGPPDHETAVRTFVELTGAPCHFIAFHDAAARPPASNRPDRFIAQRWPILREADAMAQSHVGNAVLDLIRREQAQIVIVDYVPSALCVRNVYRAQVRRITITLNREAAFFREMRQEKRVPSNASATWLANLRVAHFERGVYRRSHGVVALTDGDLPKGRVAGLRRVFSPLSTQDRSAGAIQPPSACSLSATSRIIRTVWRSNG